MIVHRYHCGFFNDGDYITYEHLHEDGWKVQSYWMIPGTQMEDGE